MDQQENSPIGSEVNKMIILFFEEKKIKTKTLLLLLLGKKTLRWIDILAAAEEENFSRDFDHYYHYHHTPIWYDDDLVGWFSSYKSDDTFLFFPSMFINSIQWWNSVSLSSETKNDFTKK